MPLGESLYVKWREKSTGQTYGRGNDTYYVDDVGDVVVELANAGMDVVQASVDYTLGADVENLVLLDFSKPEKGLVDGREVLVYGYPKRNELDYMQGDAVENYAGSCALVSIANLLTQTGTPTTESEIVRLAIQNNWALNDPQLPPSRIDVELGAKLFRHLLALPVAYFQARRVGDSVARVRELENVRAFLTGSALTVVLDLLFSVVFIAVMAYYSGWLTLIVVLSLPCYVILSLLYTPVLRARLNEKFGRGAENQAFLVETISGIDTVKSMAVEPQWTRRWDNQLAGYVAASFRTATIGTLAHGGVTMVSKLVTVATLYFGAKLVIECQLSVGQLIAFNMLAGQVAQPVMRLAQLWTDFQQTGISVQRLGDILNSPTEVAGSRSTLPPLTGRIAFEEVVFRYRPDAPDVLKQLSIEIQPGEVVGVVGRSGSGKSTLTKLIQRLYLPERGRVLVDGIDLATTDASSLRRQIGVVLQDNVLFARSVRENIALADPGASFAEVVAAARSAGAHDFIAELPQGYDTLVGEQGSTLSGGQRQRIAIARALISNPRILILDEATSALDYESERIIQNNMKSIAQGRTVIIVAHRLSAVRDAHRIVVMERGQIVEMGTHAELLQQPAGAYRALHQLQQG